MVQDHDGPQATNKRMKNGNAKSLETWIWDAACSIRGAKDAPKFKDFILPLIFTKRLCDVFDAELNRIAKEVGSRTKAFKLVKRDKKLVRFYLPMQPANRYDAVWSVIRKLADHIGLQLTTYNSGASNPTLNRNTVHAELVAYPKAKEQEDIGHILRTVEYIGRLHERKRDAFTAILRTLLHQLMTAQLR